MTVNDIELLGGPVPGSERILTPEALAFVAHLTRRFAGERGALLAAREERQRRITGGELPDFLPATAAVRAGDWRVAPAPPNPR